MLTTAAVCRAFGKPLQIEEVELAEPGPGEVGVRLAACAICHSDIHYIDGAWGGDLPAIYGHEASGIVERVGEGVTHLKPGDHAVVTLIRSCGRCPACAEGAQVACEAEFPLDRQSPLKSRNGESICQGLRTAAFARHVTVDASQAVAISSDVPLDSASLIACGVLTGVGAVINTARARAGSSAVVIGCGGVGLNSVQGARLAGCSLIIAVDIEPMKLEAAMAFGATHTINAAKENVVERVKALTGGRRADTVLVTVGAKKALEQAFSLMRRTGQTIVVGMPPSGVMAEFDPGWLAADSQRIVGSKMGSARIEIDVPMLIELYSQKRLQLDELITARYPLEHINEAVRAARAGEALRNVIVF
ncbi:MAG: Zn-dependent alcohol dehydrogenase [Hyphomicrobiaceae bacterium]|nr:MAG: Zn-dependent alcohol dehydrogenase [Hyphomicrobiaceae bacterium]